MKKFIQLTYIVFGLEVFEDGLIFFSIARCQERGSFVCKHRRTEEGKIKVYTFFFKNMYKLKAMWPLQCNAVPAK